MSDKKLIKLYVTKKWDFTENNISEYTLEELDDITSSFVLRDFLLFCMFIFLIPVTIFIVTTQLQSNCFLLVDISLFVVIVAPICKVLILKKAREYVYQLKCYQEKEDNYSLDTTTFD